MPKPKQAKALQALDTKPKRPTKIGRPSALTEAVQLEVCARMAEGESLTHICHDPAMPCRQTVSKALVSGAPEFSAFVTRYAAARESLLDVYADEILSISDDGTTDYILKVGRNGHEYMAVDQEHIQRSRLRVDTRLRLMAVVAPHIYGQKVDHQHAGTVLVKHDITSLTEREKMRRFALFMVEDQREPVIEGEASPVPAKPQDAPT